MTINRLLALFSLLIFLLAATTADAQNSVKVVVSQSGKTTFIVEWHNFSIYLSASGQLEDYNIITRGKIAYDLHGRLEQAGPVSISYDLHNRIEKIGEESISYDLHGRIDQIGAARLSYDLHGRIDQIGDTRISYDLHGRVDNVGG